MNKIYFSPFRPFVRSGIFVFVVISFICRYYSFLKRNVHLKSMNSTSEENIICILLLLCLFILPQNVLSQERFYIDYIDSFTESSSSGGFSLPIIDKAKRLKSKSAISFQIEHDANVPDSVVKCMEVASDIWRSCLNMNTNYKVRLEVVWDDLPEDQDVKVSVAYLHDPLTGNYTPTSLYYSLMSDNENDGAPDAKITINKNKTWDCGYSTENNVGMRNLNYAMLRSIAVALGFGSSLYLSRLSTGNIVKFYFSDGYSVFDNVLVSDNGTCLNELYNTGREQNPDIIKFCTGGFGAVHISGLASDNSKDSPYIMYTPPAYKENKSLIYLDNSKSLMHFSLDKTVKKLQIDTVTVNILNKIGWNAVATDNEFEIIGDGIPESGVASAYTSHSFYIDGERKDYISNARWAFYLPSVDGAETLEKSAEGSLTFNIDGLSAPENYMVNVNGDVYGKIVFTGILDGEPINLQYNVTLELKPSIFNVSFVKQGNKGLDSYNVICIADYKGADYLYVTLEEEYGSTLRSQFVREPYLAHFTCKDITSPYYAGLI